MHPLSQIPGYAMDRLARYPDSRINVRANFFSVRVISLWNRLPADLVQVNSLTKFKSMLCTVDFTFALLGKF